MTSRGDKIRRWGFWSYLLLSLIFLLRIIYEFFDRATILMYRPVGMKDEGVPTDLIEEMSKHIGTQLEYIIWCGILVCVNILIATVLFIGTRKTFAANS